MTLSAMPSVLATAATLSRWTEARSAARRRSCEARAARAPRASFRARATASVVSGLIPTTSDARRGTAPASMRDAAMDEVLFVSREGARGGVSFGSLGIETSLAPPARKQ